MDPHDTRTELDRLKISTQSDLHRMWELLMQPLGFRSTSVWVTLIGADDRPERLLIEIAESELLPETDQVRALFEALRQVISEEGDEISVAFLITRPGRDGISSFDRELTRLLMDGALFAGVACHPVHVANDVSIRAVAPDDLAA
jgi:hypothetical protein